MDNDSTRNSGRLSLQERARLGLLVEEPELWLHEVAELESTGNDMNRQVFETLLHGLAIHCGGCSMQSLPFPRFCPVKNRVVIVAWRIPRKVYLLLRQKIQPNPPAGSLIHLWLGATPGMAVSLPAESIPPVETFPLEMPVSTAQTPVSTAQTPVALGGGNPVHSRKRVADKREFIKSATWRGNQTNTVNGHPQAARFKGAYGEACLLKWASELDPRLRDKRGGRPRKT